MSQELNIQKLENNFESTLNNIKSNINNFSFIKNLFNEINEEMNELEKVYSERKPEGNSFDRNYNQSQVDSVKNVDTERKYYELYESLTEKSKSLAGAIELSLDNINVLKKNFTEFNNLLDSCILERLEELS